MASSIYGCIGLIGGSAGDVDTIVYSNLSDGDMCIAIVGGATDTVYIYTYDSSSAAAESSPDVIKPDAAGAGNGRWILVKMHVDDLTTTDDVTVGDDLVVTGLCTIGETLAVTGAITGASLQLGGAGATPTEFSTDGTMAGNSDTAIPTEKAVVTYVAAILGGVTFDLQAGYLARPTYTWVDDDTLTIGTGRIHMKAGAQSEGIHFWDSALTFEAFRGGAGGSNADNADAGTSQWHYLYVDESSLADSGATELTAANFVNNTTAPTWDADELGWYNGADRCIFAFYVDGAGDMDEWWHDGSDEVQYATTYTYIHAGYPSTNYSTTMTLIAPSFCTSGLLHLWGYTNGNAATCAHYVRPTGSSGNGLVVGESFENDNRSVWGQSIFRCPCDSSQSVDVKVDVADSNHVPRYYSLGYYLPRGM